MGYNEIYNVGQMPVVSSGYGLKTPFGIILPPGGRVAAYVRSTGPQDFDDSAIAPNLVATLAAGLARCRSGMGDAVVCLPGHTESGVGTTGMANLVAGTKIIGIGQGSAQPVFRWTATTDQWALNKADVTITGLKLRLEGANGVVKAILVTGADNTIHGCDIEVASGASAKATIALEVGTGANSFKLVNCRVRGTNTHNVTDGVKVVAAVTDLYIADNWMHFSATAGNGNIHLTAAALRCLFLRNFLFNDHTASTACIAIDAVAATGMAVDNRYATINDGTASAQGMVQGAGSLIRSFQSLSCDEPIKSGILAPAVAT